jgi:hypothetical protein
MPIYAFGSNNWLPAALPREGRKIDRANMEPFFRKSGREAAIIGPRGGAAR